MNQELAKIFYNLASYLEMEEVAFKPQAYEKAAIALEALEEDVKDVYKKGGLKALEEIPGVGKSIAEKIEEYIKTGKIKYYQDFKKRLPIKLDEIIPVEGMGPKRAKILYEKLGIKNLEELEKAARAHKIVKLFGFGAKSEKNILDAIEFLKREKGRFLLGEILPKVREVSKKLKKIKGVERVDSVGSIRRMKETIGDVDFLVVVKGSKGSASARASADAVADFFVSLPGVIKIWGKGKTKASVRMEEGFDMDIRVLPKRSYGAALQYFTGSKEHNIVLRKLAIEKGLKLSEYGLFRGPKMIASETEEGIYKALGLQWIPPEIRENQGEIEAAQKGKLPKLIDYNDIKGDLHCHSNWDGGENSIEEIVEVAESIGYEYMGITEHTKFLKIDGGIDEKQLLAEKKEIEKINEKLLAKNKKIKVLQGCETNILGDGKLDIKDDVLAQLDYVIAGVHSQMKMSKKEMTERIIKAIKNPNVDIISHPTGRLIKRRDEYEIDFDKIIKVAKETGTILEINSYPERLDLKDTNIRKAKTAGVKMVINTDSHHTDQMRFIDYGVAQARRGWAEKEDIINTRPLEKLLKFFK
jgi:DNA polymerase (family 10)